LEFFGKYYLSFNTTDKQTGIDQYAVMEQLVSEFGTFSWAGADAPWVTTRSPHTLDDQSLNSVLRVSALDQAVHEYVATLIPDETMRTISAEQMRTYGVFAVIGFIMLCCFAIVISVLVSRIRKKKSNSKVDEEEIIDEDNTKEYEN